MLVLRGFHIAIRGKRTDKFPLLRQDFPSRHNLFRGIPAIHHVDDVFYPDFHAASFSNIVVAVIAFIDSDIPHMQQRKQALHIFPDLQIIPAKTAVIFGNDYLYFPIPHLPDHFLKSHPVKPCPADTIIHKLSGFTL